MKTWKPHRDSLHRRSVASGNSGCQTLVILASGGWSSYKGWSPEPMSTARALCVSVQLTGRSQRIFSIKHSTDRGKKHVAPCRMRRAPLSLMEVVGSLPLGRKRLFGVIVLSFLGECFKTNILFHIPGWRSSTFSATGFTWVICLELLRKSYGHLHPWPQHPNAASMCLPSFSFCHLIGRWLYLFFFQPPATNGVAGV